MKIIWKKIPNYRGAGLPPRPAHLGYIVNRKQRFYITKAWGGAWNLQTACGEVCDFRLLKTAKKVAHIIAFE